MTMTRVNEIISEFDLLKHSFYQAWSNGELSLDTLKRYTAQKYYQVASFPLFISQTHANCPDLLDVRNPDLAKVRQMLLDNLFDEEFRGTPHPALWMQFANGLGVSKEEVVNETLLPETLAMVNTFQQLAKKDWRDGLCALYAYEYQVPGISAAKMAGLKKFYGIEDEHTLEFFTVHQIYDVKHSSQVAELMAEHVEPERATRATREAAAALWGFLDGMCRVSGIPCCAASSQEVMHA